MLDADADPPRRWERVRRALARSGLSAPEAPQTGGLVLPVSPSDEGDLEIERLGVWMMPDNGASGALEDFLARLVPQDRRPVFAWAQAATDEARRRGAPLREAHILKGRLHAYLAWQERPGRPLGAAVTARVLDPRGPEADGFVARLQRVFQAP